MRTIDASLITESVKELCIDTTHILNKPTLNKLKQAYNMETEELPKNILNQIIENDCIAEKEMIPMCQDTGITLVFLEIGTELSIIGNVEEAVNNGVKSAYSEAYLRKSVVSSPLSRINTNDNTPAVIHYKLVPGDKIKITVAPKGAGSENMSKIKMLNPADGILGIKEFIVKSVIEAGGRPCPPLVLGIGIGGTMDKAALLSKEALLREIDDESPDEQVRILEKEILDLVNQTNVGPMGLGGKVTALAVKIETYPCHIASLPVALTFQCHANRHKAVIL